MLSVVCTAEVFAAIYSGLTLSCAFSLCQNLKFEKTIKKKKKKVKRRMENSNIELSTVHDDGLPIL